MQDIGNARRVVIASYLGWTLDAFDYFIMIFVFDEVAHTFGVGLTTASLAITLTLAMRAVGALIFGRLADRYGRRPVMMINILCFSGLELLSGLAPTLLAFMFLRALFGVAMGGEWGVGSSLTMETITGALARLGLRPAAGRLPQRLSAGDTRLWYSRTLYRLARPIHCRRPAGAAGALYPPQRAREPGLGAHPGEAEGQDHRGTAPPHRAHDLCGDPDDRLQLLQPRHAGHLSQGLLKAQHGFSHGTITAIALTYNIGAILGGLSFGAISQHIGRRRAMVIAALLSLPVIPLWAFAASPWVLGLGAFLMQFMVQGAWGIIPAHLNELSPGEIRGTFPGVVYQLGNFLASYNATLQTAIGARYNHNYSYALAGVAGIVAVVIALLVGFGVENRHVKLGNEAREAERLA